MVELSDELFLLEKQLFRMRGDLDASPDASIVIPVNAQKDLANISRLLSDLGHYSGDHRIEIILVINNYPLNDLPYEIELYEQIGITVIAIPRVEHDGGVAIAARIPGIKAARSSNILLFDADCRIPNPTALINWYVAKFKAGYDLAYTHVDYTDLAPDLSVKARIWVHHASRWLKRNLLGIPTSRGSNYAIRRNLILDLFQQGRVPYDLHVGPVVKWMGGQIAYSGAPELVVLTSGRFFAPGWKVLVDYLVWRVGYYRRILKLRTKKSVTDQ
jgi:hypothetical protein